MRRWAPLLLLALLLGLLTSVAIAWLGASLNRENWPDVPLTRGTVERAAVVDGWLINETSDATCTRRLIRLWHDSPVPPYLNLVSLPEDEKPSIGRSSIVRTQDAEQVDHDLVAIKARVWEREAGWPLRCLRTHHAVADHRVAIPGEYVRGGLHIAPWEWPWSHAVHQRQQPEKYTPGLHPLWEQEVEVDNALPLTPIWLGLLANTIVFALAWMILLMLATLPGLIRTLWRRRRDRCTRCGYPLSGGDICSECGKPRTQRQPLMGVLPTVVGALAMLVLAFGLVFFAHRQWDARPMLPPLHHAAATGNVYDIGIRLAAGNDVNEGVDIVPGVDIQMSGSTPLSWAAARGQKDAAAALLKAGASPDGVGNARMNFAPAPVALAARTDDARMCKLLLDAGANPLHHPNRFNLALADALDWGGADPEIIALILTHTPTGKVPDLLPRRMGTYFRHEIGRQPVPVFTLLLEHFDWDESQLYEIATYQIENDWVMEALIAKGLPIEDMMGRDLLAHAIEIDVARASFFDHVRGAPQTRAALALGISPQRDAHLWPLAELWPLREALQSPDTARALLEAGADPLERGYGRTTLLHELARMSGNVEAMDLLELPQMSGRVEVMHLLLDAGVPIDARDDRGRTPLHQAVVYCRGELVEALLAEGANPMARDDQGQLPREIKPNVPHGDKAAEILILLDRAEAEWEQR